MKRFWTTMAVGVALSGGALVARADYPAHGPAANCATCGPTRPMLPPRPPSIATCTTCGNAGGCDRAKGCGTAKGCGSDSGWDLRGKLRRLIDWAFYQPTNCYVKCEPDRYHPDFYTYFACKEYGPYQSCGGCKSCTSNAAKPYAVQPINPAPVGPIHATSYRPLPTPTLIMTKQPSESTAAKIKPEPRVLPAAYVPPRLPPAKSTLPEIYPANRKTTPPTAVTYPERDEPAAYLDAKIKTHPAMGPASSPDRP